MSMPGTTSTPVKTLFVEHILVLSQFLDAFNLLIVSEIFYDLDILGQVFTPFIAHSKGRFHFTESRKRQDFFRRYRCSRRSFAALMIITR